MASKRKLDNWLDSFVEWVLPRSESPESMIRWAGLFTLATISRRRVYWPESLLGGYQVFPNLYIIYVADPGVVRKSTTVNFSERLLSSDKLKGKDAVTFAGDITSHSKLLSSLSESPDSSVAVVSSEFSSLIQTTPESMYEILIELYDNKRKLRWSTWAHGDKETTTPVVNLITATTPAWVSNQPPEYFVGGGFASRVLFVYEENPRQREIYYDHLDWDALGKLEEFLSDDLAVIAQVKGEVTHDSPKTKEFIREWYKDSDIQPEDPRMKGYHARRHVHAHKVAMLLSLAERNDRKVTKKHFERAISILEELETKLPRVFANVGPSSFSSMMEEILRFVENRGSASLRDVAGRFYLDGFTLDQLNSALAFLCTSGKLKASGTSSIIYRPVDD